MEYAKLKTICADKFSDRLLPKKVFGPARKSDSLLASIRIALSVEVKCPLTSKKSTVTLHTAAACSCRPKTFFRGERCLQMSGSGSNVFRSINPLYNSSAKKDLPPSPEFTSVILRYLFLFQQKCLKNRINCINFVLVSFALRLHFLVQSSNT